MVSTWRLQLAVAALTSLMAASAVHAEDPDTATDAAPQPGTHAIVETDLTGPEPEGLGAVVRKKLADELKSYDDQTQLEAHALREFYLARKNEPLWITSGALNPKAEAVIAEIKKADDWGLKAKDYDVPAAQASLEGDKAADAEMMLSMTVLHYARDARGGRIIDPAKQLSTYLDRLPQLLEPKTVLEQIAASSEPDATLRGFHPKHPQFEKLRQAYLAMRDRSKAEEIVKLPAKGQKLMPGQKNADVVLLRKRLKVALPEGQTDETLYDEALASAVKAFQKEKGLRPDAIVGSTTRAAFNDVEGPSPLRYLANMEEWRWMPEDMGSYYVWVNVPEFMIRVSKGGNIVHEERVITGLPDKQSPIFSDEMELVTFHPSWNVPESIKIKELLPSLARGGTYFQRQGLKLSQNGRPIDPSSVDWGSTDIRKFDIQQPPGGSNVLGVVKFSFPNKHTVYMHDTATKGLFEESVRAFSHGCMRVRNPMKLAEIILGEDKGWDAAKVGDMVKGTPIENRITLDKKVPVHITYFTTWIADDGTEQRWKDIYGHEKRISLAIEGRFAEIVKGPDHLAPTPMPKVEYASNPLDTFFSNLFGGGGF